MQKSSEIQTRFHPLLASMAFIPLALAGCNSGNNRDDSDVFSADVSAAAGGTFASDDGGVSVTIPAAALSADTTVTVTRKTGVDDPEGTLAGDGDVYEISFGTATLSAPATLALKADSVPTHPGIGETAIFADGTWTRVKSNFFRNSDRTAISLISDAGTYTPVIRTLQADSGDMVERGKALFLDETYGNEEFFGGVLGLHTLLNGLTPAQAVAAGVQVDITKVPQGIVDVLTGNDFAAKSAALNDPAITQALLKADAVIGVKSSFADANSTTLTSAGITCALCHVSVETNEFELSAGNMTALPIGAIKLDGAPNLTMDAGAILSLTPFAQTAGQATVDFLASFGPGAFDVRALPDNPLEDNVANPTSVPPIWNFKDLTEQGYTFNWDGLFKSSGDTELALASQAEAVFDLVMHANGAFGTSTGTVPPQLSITPPEALLTVLAQAEADAPGNVIIPQQDLIDIQAFQRSIVSPAPVAFDEALAEEGFMLFNGKAQCSGCHQTAEFTGPVVTANITLDAPEGGLAGGIKTPGLRGIAYTAPYFHDGSAATLADMMDVYSGRIVNALSEDEQTAVIEYLKTL